MWKFITNLLYPVAQTASVDDLKLTPGIVSLTELRSLFTVLHDEFKQYPTTDLDKELFAEIIKLMVAIKHYPPEKLAPWQNLGDGYFDSQYINELKGASRHFTYTQQSQVNILLPLMGAAPAPPFKTTEYILNEIARGLEINTLEHYQELVNECDDYEARSLSLLKLSTTEKKNLINTLKTEHYAKKFEVALSHYIDVELKDETSFRYLAERILTFTAVDFMLKINTAPISIAGHSNNLLCKSYKVGSANGADESSYEDDGLRRKATLISSTPQSQSF